MYLDGKLIARAWELARPGALTSQVSSLSASLLFSPKYGAPPAPEDLDKVKMGVTVFYRFHEIKDETELNEGEGVVVMNGFKEGVGVPGDIEEGGKATELLGFASVVGGMREGAWLLPESTILAATVDDEREK
jgi:AMMECR1 domain-containing protein